MKKVLKWIKENIIKSIMILSFTIMGITITISYNPKDEKVDVKIKKVEKVVVAEKIKTPEKSDKNIKETPDKDIK